MKKKITIEYPEEMAPQIKMIKQYLQSKQEVNFFLEPDELQKSDLHINLPERTVTVIGRRIPLSTQEFNVLYYLAFYAQQVLTKEQILEAAGSEDPQDEDNAVRCLIAGIRKKLRTYTGKEYIQTVRGVGYRFVIPEE